MNINKWKNINVIIDRVENSNVQEAKREIEQVLAILKPMKDEGLRVRICRSTLTLVEDKAWRSSPR